MATVLFRPIILCFIFLSLGVALAAPYFLQWQTDAPRRHIIEVTAGRYGSPTVNNGILVAVAGLIEEIKGLKFKNKKAAAFGSYGWSGEAVKIISERLGDSGFHVVDEGFSPELVA
jgi:flavorubredoxin